MNETIAKNQDHFATDNTNKQKFNELKHIPPKYDIFGRLKKVKFHPDAEKVNLLSEKESIKVPWGEKTNPGGSDTRSELLQTRRREKLPDISYDLDRDGYVGGRDYVLAKRFDKDGDGKLNEQETKQAFEAIHNNYEDKFVWNLENQGVNRGYRIIQKRGEIVDAEDFSAIRKTYPEHPLSAVKPKYRTLDQLKDRRRNLTKTDIEAKTKRWDLANPAVLVAEPIKLAGNEKSHHLSKKEKKEIEHRKARLECGLKEYEDDIRPPKDFDPTLNYVYQPKHKTIRDVKEESRKENIESNKLLAHQVHKNEVTRLNERENDILGKLHQDEDRKTINKIKSARRKENLEFNIKNFSNQTIGVHGHELPKFADNQKEWWTLKEDWVANPNISSAALLKEQIKYWKKPEELLINQHETKIASPDNFSKIKVLKDKTDDLIIKVNNLNHFKDFDPENPKPIDVDELKKNHIYKWTTLVHQFAPQKFKKGRFFDSLPKAENNNMYNSSGEDINFDSAFMKAALKKDDKNIKINDMGGNNIEGFANQTKETLFQKFSNRDNNLRPKTFVIRTKGL